MYLPERRYRRDQGLPTNGRTLRSRPTSTGAQLTNQIILHRQYVHQPTRERPTHSHQLTECARAETYYGSLSIGGVTSEEGVLYK